MFLSQARGPSGLGPSCDADLLGSADAALLIRSRNPAYMRLQIELEGMKLRVQKLETENMRLELALAGLQSKCDTIE